MNEPVRISQSLRRALRRRSEGRCECTAPCARHRGERCNRVLGPNDMWGCRNVGKLLEPATFDELEAVCAACTPPSRDPALWHFLFGVAYRYQWGDATLDPPFDVPRARRALEAAQHEIAFRKGEPNPKPDALQQIHRDEDVLNQVADRVATRLGGR